MDSTAPRTGSMARAKAKYISAVIIYGTIGMILRAISLPSEVVVLCRGLLGSGFVLLYVLCRHTPPDRRAIRRNLLWLVISGVGLGLNWVFLFAAYRRTTVAIASLCNYMAPMIVLVLSPLLYRERLGGKKLLCVLAALTGIVLVSGVLTESPEEVNLPGIALGLAAALGFVALIICNRKLQGISAYDKVIVQLFVSALTVLPYVLAANRGSVLTPDMRSILLTLLLCVFHTGVAYCLYFGSLSEIPTQTMAVWGYMEPVVSVLCSTLILAEALPLTGWVGAALILGAAIASEFV